MPTDLNSLAAQLVNDATNEQSPADDGKDPAAVALGREGGLKGGHTRAAKIDAGRAQGEREEGGSGALGQE